MKALIVDDDKDILGLELILLMRNGFENHDIEIHYDYDFIPTEDYAVCILDYQCPPCNGNNWLEQYRDLIDEQRCMLVTGAGKDGWVQHDFKGTILNKPFSIDEFKSALDHAVNLYIQSHLEEVDLTQIYIIGEE